MKHTDDGKLILATSNSFRRFLTDRGTPVCVPITQRSDGHPDLHFPNGGPDGPDARRFLACWNSLNGISNEMLEQVGDIVAPARVNYRTLQRERDDLIEALRDLIAAADFTEDSEAAMLRSGKAYDAARALLAKYPKVPA